MARQISELNSLHFHQLIGAPLLAIVQAQAQAAQATSEFIEQIGFKRTNQKNSNNATNDSLGDLRMVTFTYRKPDDSVVEVEVPLLSLVPIPAIEVKDVEVEFFMKVNDVESTDASTVLRQPNVTPDNWLSNKRLGLKGSIGKFRSPTQEQQNGDLEMKIKIKLGQADIPAGLSHLFLIMDQSINSTSTG